MSTPATIMQTTFETIGTLHSCFKEKFGIPRQPGLATAATGTLELTGAFATMDAVRGLEQCSHIWVLFLFSEHLHRGWAPLVRPPRSKGSKMGVFATRSTFRPNPLGMSVVKLERIESVNGKPLLHVSGVDILDGSPVVDIKPYLPYADSIPDAYNNYAPDSPKLALPLRYNAAAKARLAQLDKSVESLIEQVILCDPRPVQHHHNAANRSYGVRLNDFNVRWTIADSAVEVIAIEPIKQTAAPGT